jgi:hypothetical protein
LLFVAGFGTAEGHRRGEKCKIIFCRLFWHCWRASQWRIGRNRNSLIVYKNRLQYLPRGGKGATEIHGVRHFSAAIFPDAPYFFYFNLRRFPCHYPFLTLYYLVLYTRPLAVSARQIATHLILKD